MKTKDFIIGHLVIPPTNLVSSQSLERKLKIFFRDALTIFGKNDFNHITYNFQLIAIP